MDRIVLGWPPDGPQLRLDWRRFSYAGKFIVTSTGKAVIREGEPDDTEFADDVIAAVAFNEDRTDPSVLWLRYVTVVAERRGEGLGPALCSYVTIEAFDRGYDTVRIAVNNPFAYEALYKAGFAYTGRETGIAELVLERPAERTQERYREGLDQFRHRDLTEGEKDFIDDRDRVPNSTADQF